MTASAARVIDRSPSPKCSLTAGGIVPAGRPMRTAAASGPNQSARSTNRMKPVEQNTSDRAERFFTGDCLCANRFSSKPRRKTCGSQVLQTAEVSLPSRPPSSPHETTTLHRQLHPVVLHRLIPRSSGLSSTERSWRHGSRQNRNRHLWPQGAAHSGAHALPEGTYNSGATNQEDSQTSHRTRRVAPMRDPLRRNQ